MKLSFSLVFFLVSISTVSAQAPSDWEIESQGEWEDASGKLTGMAIEDGLVVPDQETAVFASKVKRFDETQKPKHLVLEQSPSWEVWEPCENIGPQDARNAPVFLPVAEGDYWFFAEKKGLSGYQAWHSTDLESWDHKGSTGSVRWATTAEYVDGKIFLYFDKPNDQDPHLVLGTIEDDGNVSWEQKGMVFADPSHGSDAGILRDEDGTFHLIYEDWSPIDAKAHSWDSPLAGHADSPDGIQGFTFGDNPPAIDHRTTPTGKMGSYQHRASGAEPLTYEIHEPEQNAYGDYTNIKVGDRYYLFCDFHPANDKIRIGYFSRDRLDQPYAFGGSLGMGHPDPSIGFAEGRFYLCVQRADKDWSSTGPWVDGVEARVGVDTDDDGQVDQWTEWQSVRESYTKKPGFARIVDVAPAQLDLADLPEGNGFQFEFRTKGVMVGERVVYPEIDRVRMRFE